MEPVFYKIDPFIRDSFGWGLLLELASQYDYEVESAWLLRWLTLDSADEITADECMAAAVLFRDILLHPVDEDYWGESFWGDIGDAYESESSYHPSEIEVEYLDDPIDPADMMHLILPPMQAPAYALDAYARNRPYGDPH